MSKGLFITGTGTDIGKTFVAGLMVKKLKDAGLRAAYYKAAMSGNDRDAEGKLIPGDAKYVNDISGINQPLEEMCPYVYENAVSPHLASQMEGNPVALPVVRRGYDEISKKYDYITMEGSGGILCPIRFDEQEIWLEDVIRLFKLKTLIIAQGGLGTINSTVLTTEYMRKKGLDIRGIILNHCHPGNRLEEDNRKMIEYMTKCKVLACVKDNDRELDIKLQELTALYE